MANLFHQARQCGAPMHHASTSATTAPSAASEAPRTRRPTAAPVSGCGAERSADRTAASRVACARGGSRDDDEGDAENETAQRREG